MSPSLQEVKAAIGSSRSASPNFPSAAKVRQSSADGLRLSMSTALRRSLPRHIIMIGATCRDILLSLLTKTASHALSRTPIPAEGRNRKLRLKHFTATRLGNVHTCRLSVSLRLTEDNPSTACPPVWLPIPRISRCSGPLCSR